MAGENIARAEIVTAFQPHRADWHFPAGTVGHPGGSMQTASEESGAPRSDRQEPALRLVTVPMRFEFLCSAFVALFKAASVDSVRVRHLPTV